MNSRYSGSVHPHAKSPEADTADAAPLGSALAAQPQEQAHAAVAPASVPSRKSPSTKLPSTLPHRRLKAWLLGHPIPILLGTFTIGLISGRRLFRS